MILIGIQGNSQHSSAYISLYLFSVSFSLSICSQKLSSISSRLYKIPLLSTAYFLSNQLECLFPKFLLHSIFLFPNFFLFQNTFLKEVSTSKPSFYCKEAAKSLPPPFFFENVFLQNTTLFSEWNGSFWIHVFETHGVHLLLFLAACFHIFSLWIPSSLTLFLLCLSTHAS